MDDQVEDLRLHGNGNLLAAELASISVEQMVPEQKLHVKTQASRRHRQCGIKTDFDMKSVSPARGRGGSPRLRDGCHADFEGECNLDENWQQAKRCCLVNPGCAN
jgi:hypothetical protein